jgi:hypothetical protein
MTKRNIARGISTVAVHAVLAAVALIVAYVTWTRDKTEVKSDRVMVLDVNKRDLSQVTYKDENRTVTVERKLTDKGDAYAWVTVTTKSKTLVTPPPPAAPPTTAPQDPHAAPLAADKGKAVPAPPSPPAPLPKGEGGRTADKGKAEPKADKAAQKGGDKAAAGKEGEKTAPPPPAAPAAAPPAASPAPGTPPAGAAPPPSPHEIKETTTVKSFRGSEQADKLLESFAPLMAERSLGKVDDAKAKELGLTESKKSLTVTAKGLTAPFTIGTTSYGAGDVYVRDDKGQVFLLSSRFASDFEYAESRLMERRLHRFERPDITGVEIQVGQKKKSLVQQKRQDPVNYFWAEQATPEKRDDTLRNWMDKILRVAISDYVAKGEEPQGPAMSQAPGAGTPQYGEVMTIRFLDGKKEVGKAVFSRYPKGTQTEYYASTETTIGLVKLLPATIESALQDAEKW